MAWVTPRTWAANDEATAAIMNQELRDNLGAAFPVGSIHYFMQAASTVETTINGFALECNAVLVARATYANLNSKLSGLAYPFGAGDGSTTMGLPDFQGRAPYGMSSGGNADVNTLGDSDALAKASRSPKHNSTNGVTAGIGTLALSGTTANVLIAAAGANGLVNTGIASTVGATTLGLGGAPSIGGTIGPGGTRPNDLSPWLVAGIFAVKY